MSWHFTFATVSLIVKFGDSEMARGTVKWFNSQKGYGFIQPQGGGGKDVFVHISAVEKAGLSSLNEGQIVEYEEVSNKGKTSAENLKVCNRIRGEAARGILRKISNRPTSIPVHRRYDFVQKRNF